MHYPPEVSHSVQFGKTAADYAKYRVGLPSEVFAKLAERGLVGAQTRALDLGTGTGTAARGLAQVGCRVTGLDPSPDLLRQAEVLDRAAGVRVRYVVGTAEETGLPSASFDLITAVQCWHWFNPERALREISRLLVDGGLLAIGYFDWLTTDGSLTDFTERLIAEHNPEWTAENRRLFFRREGPDVPTPTGFVEVERLEYSMPVRYTHEAWRGRIRASAPIGASMPPEGIEAFDRAHARMLAERFPEDPLSIPHRVWMGVWRKG